MCAPCDMVSPIHLSKSAAKWSGGAGWGPRPHSFAPRGHIGCEFGHATSPIQVVPRSPQTHQVDAASRRDTACGRYPTLEAEVVAGGTAPGVGSGAGVLSEASGEGLGLSLRPFTKPTK